MQIPSLPCDDAPLPYADKKGKGQDKRWNAHCEGAALHGRGGAGPYLLLSAHHGRAASGSAPGGCA